MLVLKMELLLATTDQKYVSGTALKSAAPWLWLRNTAHDLRLIKWILLLLFLVRLVRMVVRKGTWKLSNSSCLIWSCGVLATKIRNTLTALQHLIRCADCEVFQHPELRNEKKSKTSTGSSCFFNADPETDSALKLYKKNCGTLWRVFLSKKKTKTIAQKQKTMEHAEIYLQKFHKITIITNFLALFV